MAPVCFFLFFSAALEYSELLIELGPADLTDFTTALLHCRHQVPIYFFWGGIHCNQKRKVPHHHGVPSDWLSFFFYLFIQDSSQLAPFLCLNYSFRSISHSFTKRKDVTISKKTEENDKSP
jgi:hypothetical protein